MTDIEVPDSYVTEDCINNPCHETCTSDCFKCNQVKVNPYQCQGKCVSTNDNCKRSVRKRDSYCWQHIPDNMKDAMLRDRSLYYQAATIKQTKKPTEVATKKQVKKWEDEEYINNMRKLVVSKEKQERLERELDSTKKEHEALRLKLQLSSKINNIKGTPRNDSRW